MNRVRRAVQRGNARLQARHSLLQKAYRILWGPLLSLWFFVLRRLEHLSTWLVGSLFVVAMAGGHLMSIAEPSWALKYYILPSDKISPDAELNQWMVDSHLQIALRTAEMVRALDYLFVEVPASEQPTNLVPLRSVIRVNGGRGIGGLGALPVDHFFLEWLPALTETEQDFAKLHLAVISGAPTEEDKGGVAVRTFVRKVPGSSGTREKNIHVTVFLNDEPCKQEFGTEVEPNTGHFQEDITEDIKNIVAACILSHYIAHRLRKIEDRVASLSWSDRMRRFTKSMNAAGYFQQLYEPIEDMGDMSRRTDLFVGLHFYAQFVRTWEKQSIGAREALQKAVDRFHAAIGDDMADSKVPRSPFAEYLYVHAATTEHIGIPDRTGQFQAKKPEPHMGVHATRLFQIWPYSCAKWAHTMALQASADPALLPAEWEKVISESEPDLRCERISEPEKINRIKSLANAQLASAYFHANQWGKFIQTRWPRVIKALLEAKQRNSHDTKIPPDGHQNLDAAEILFEGGFDAMLIFDTAAQYHEMIAITQRLISFAEQDMLLLRDAVEGLVKIEGVKGSNSPISPDIGIMRLVEGNQELDATLKRCSADATSNNCEGLRETIRKWLAAVMDVSHKLSLLCLEQSLSTLELTQAYYCPIDLNNHAPALPECPSGKASTLVSSPIASAEATSAPMASSNASPAGSNASLPTYSPSDLERAKIRKLLVQVNDIMANARVFWTIQQCRAPWDHSTPTLQQLIDKADEVLNKSPLSPLMGSALYECAFVLAASSSDLGKRLVEQHRRTTLLDAWSWEPPSAKMTWEQEHILNQNPTLREAKEGEALKARLHYPGAWEVLSTYKNATWEPQPDELKELARAAQQAFSKTKAWDEKKQREAIWTWVMTGADEKDHSNDLRTAMETVGKELWRGALRRDRPASDEASTCRPILALIACGTTEANELGKRPECEGLPKQRCPLDIEKDRYNGFGDPIPQSASEVATTIHTMYLRAMDARWVLTNQLSEAVRDVLAPFFNEATHAVVRNTAVPDLTLPFAALRLAAASRQISELTPVLMPMAPHMAQVIVNHINNDSVLLLREPDLVRALSGTTPFTHEKKLVQSEDEALSTIDASAASYCWPKAGTEQEKRRWLRRFLSHVALNQHFYQQRDSTDRAAFQTLELSTAYEAWCHWASDGQKPLVKDENILALAWMWQVDGVGMESNALVNGDALMDYLVARKLVELGGPNQALNNSRGLDSGEGNLLRARAAVQAGRGDLAIHYAVMAKMLMPPDGLGLFEGELMKTLGDAYLLTGTKFGNQDPADYWKAMAAYAASPIQGSALIIRRRAAAFIELQRPQDAVSLLLPSHKSPDHCWKNDWLLAIANRMRGIKPKAIMSKLLANAMYTVDDLPLQTSPDPCGTPVPIGDTAKKVGRMLLEENQP